MGSMAEDFREMREAYKERRDQRYRKNWRVLEEARDKRQVRFAVRNHGDVVLFRMPGRPEADFYPGTGRWRAGGKTYSGGAKRFLEWYLR